MTTEFTNLVDLASERLGGAVLYANDDFFAPKENLLQAGAPVWREGLYTERGKWMDGWESRRRRTPGFDWCLVRLGLAGRVRGVVVDTSFFRGNFPESCSLEACAAPSNADAEQLSDAATEWVEILPQARLEGDAHRIRHDEPSPRAGPPAHRRRWRRGRARGGHPRPHDRALRRRDALAAGVDAPAPRDARRGRGR
jgi:allantoicase